MIKKGEKQKMQYNSKLDIIRARGLEIEIVTKLSGTGGTIIQMMRSKVDQPSDSHESHTTRRLRASITLSYIPSWYIFYSLGAGPSSRF